MCYFMPLPGLFTFLQTIRKPELNLGEQVAENIKVTSHWYLESFVLNQTWIPQVPKGSLKHLCLEMGGVLITLYQ